MCNQFFGICAWGAVVTCVIGTVCSVQGQVANDDYYTTTAGSTFSVPPPGILANDTGAGNLTAALVTGPANGLLSLNADGSFTYTPTNNFAGVDGFTYQTTDGSQTSSVASVTIMILAPGELFHDDFSRPTNSSSIFPWILQLSSPVPTLVPTPSGTWNISNQAFIGSSTTYYTYTTACLDRPSWTNYSVEAQFQISATDAIGSGLGGRLNPSTGARYAVWIYPENAPETISPGVASMAIYKYEDWTTYTVGNFMPLPGLGTSRHAVKLSFEGNQISAYFDGLLVTNWTDDGSFDGQPDFTNGGIDVETYKNPVSYTTTVENVVVNILTNIPPSASDDIYSDPANTSLTIGAPGVLANDTGGNGPLTAILASGPSHGSLTLSNNGGFTYTPAVNFNGWDSFTYQSTDGQATSSVATIEISVTPTGGFFYDNFVRPGGATSIFPWVQESGSWGMTNGLLIGNSAMNDYGHVFYENANWTNYSVQAQIQFSDINAWGGGIGGRLNPATGTHYAVWIYPEGSPFGPMIGSPAGLAALQLIKFKSWNTFTLLGSPMPLPGVGTNWHNLKLAFRGTNIITWFDGSRITNAVDDGSFDGQASFANGGVSLDLWTAAPTAYTLSISNVMVNPLMLNNRFKANENTQLVVTNPGVLNNITDVYGTNPIVTLVTGPTNGTVALDTNGGFIYLPATNFVGADGFTIQASDGSYPLGTATISVNVIPALATPPPVITSINLTNDAVVISWSSVPEATYRVQSIDDLNSTLWNDVSPDVKAADTTTTQTNNFDGVAQRYYRILLLSP